MAKKRAAHAGVNKLKKFLLDTAQDPDKWAEFERDPDAVMTAAGISKSDQAALKSRNQERIRRALKAGPRAFLMVLISFGKK